jgi:rRNA maturation endonuclease Nob1
MGLLPDGHEEPRTITRYLKLDDGENVIRVLDAPVMGYVYWTVDDEDKKVPVRVRETDEIPLDVQHATNPKEKAKRFWMLPILNKNTGMVQVFEATQATIRERLNNLDRDKDWGDLREYDIKVVKTGSGKNTEYSVNPVPHSKLSKEVQQLVKQDLANINLERVFDGKSPFVSSNEE